MWIRVIQIISIIMCLTATGINVIGFVRTNRTYKRLKETLEFELKFLEKLKLLYKEKTENSEINTEVKNYEND